MFVNGTDSVLLPSGALLLITSPGNIVYSPNGAYNFLGLGDQDVDEFTYTIRDAGGQTDVGTIQVTLTGRNDQPVVTDIASTVLSGAFTENTNTDSTVNRSIVGNVTFTDTDASDTHTAVASGPVVTWARATDSVSLAEIGNINLVLTETVADPTPVLEFASDGSLVSRPPPIEGDVSFTYNVAEGDLDFLAVDETLTLVYTITVTDDSGVGAGGGGDSPASVSRNVTVTITGTNDVPTIAAATDVTETLAESELALATSGSFDVLDVDITDVVSITGVSVAATGVLDSTLPDNATLLGFFGPQSGVEIIGTEIDGTVSWNFATPVDQFDYLGVGDTLVLTYTVTLADDNGASVPQDVVITIEGTNDTPFIAAETDVSHTFAESEAALTTTGSFDVTDVDKSDVVSITGVSVAATGVLDSTLPDNATLLGFFGPQSGVEITGTEIDGTVSWNFATPVDQFDYLGVGDTLVLTYTVTLADDNGASVPQDVVITIEGTNDTPFIAAETDVSHTFAESEAALTTTGSFDVTDVDKSDVVSITGVSVAATGVVDATLPDNATLLGFFGPQSGVEITGTEIDGTVSWNFATPVDQFDYLGVGDTLVLTYTVTLADDNGASVPQDVVITIEGTNDTPFIAAETDVSHTFAESEAALTTTGSFDVTDVDKSDVVSITGVSVAATGVVDATLPDNATLLGFFGPQSGVEITGTEIDGTVSWNFATPVDQFDYLGVGDTLVLTYTVTLADDNGASVPQDVVITIEGTNDTPFIAAETDVSHTFAESEAALTTTGSFDVTDVDKSDVVSITGVSVAATGVVDATLPDNATLLGFFGPQSGVEITGTEIDGTVSWNFATPVDQFDYLGVGDTLVLTYTVTLADDNGASVPQDVVITIEGTNDTPFIAAETDVSHTFAESEAALTTTGSFDVTDVDKSDVVSITGVSVAATGVVDATLPDNATLLGFFGPQSGVEITGTEIDGTVSWNFATPVDQFDYLGVGDTLVLTYTVTLADDNGASVPQDVVITIEGTNDTPFIAAETDVSHTFAESEAALTTTGSFDVTDVDKSDVVSITGVSVAATGVVDATLPDNATLLGFFGPQSGVEITGTEIDGTVSWNFATPVDQFDYLGVGDTLVLTYTVTLADDNGASVPQDVVITIEGTNDTPFIAAETDVSHTFAESEAALTTTGSFDVTDVDKSDVVSITGVSVAATGVVDATLPDNATLLGFFGPQSGVEITGTEIDGTVSWNFATPVDQFDYLGVGDTLVLTYTVTLADDNGASVPQDVVITIEGTNDTPFIAAETDVSHTFAESEAALTTTGSFDVTDVDKSDVVSITGVSVAATGVVDATLPDNATLLGFFGPQSGVEITGTEIDGTVSWNFATPVDQFDYLGVGDTLVLTYTVTLADDNGASVPQDVVITIEGTNDTPFIAAETDVSHTFAESEAALTTTGSFDVTDVDKSDVVSITGVSVAATGVVDATLPDNATLLGFFGPQSGVEITGTEIDGTVSWNFATPVDQFDYLGVGDTLVLTYTVTLADDNGASVPQDVVITIEGTNDTPFIAAETDVSHTFAESEAALTTTGSFDVTDVDKSDVVSITGVSVAATGVVDATLPDNATLLGFFGPQSGVEITGTEIDGTVSWNFATPVDQFDYLGVGDTLVLTYTVTLADDNGASVPQDVVITIEGTNDTPFIAAETDVSHTFAESEAALTTTGSFDVTDVDKSDVVSITGVSVAATGVVDATLPDNATLLGFFGPQSGVEITGTEIDGTVSWNFATPVDQFDYLGVGDTLVLTYTVTLADDNGASVPQDVVITIEGTNDTPFIAAETDVSHTFAESEAALTTTGSFDVTDVDKSDVVSITGVSVAATGVVDATLPDNATLLGFFGPQSGVEITGTEIDGTVSWNFATPVDQFDYLGVGDTLVLTYTVTLADDNGASVPQDVVITIEGTNDTPFIAAETDVSHTFAESEAALTTTGSFDVTDVDKSDVVSITGVSVAATGVVDATLPDNATLLGFFGPQSGVEITGTEIDGTVSWNFATPVDQFDYLGVGDTLVLTYTVTLADDNGASVPQDVVITIEGTNDTPFIAAETDVSHTFAESEAALTTTGSFDVTDVDKSDVVSITGVSVAATGVVDATLPDNATLLGFFGPQSGVEITGTEIDGTVSWNFATPVDQFDYLGVGDTLVLTYTVTLADDNGASVPQDVVITIEGTNDTPVVSAAASPVAVNEGTSPVLSLETFNLLSTVTATDVDDGETPTVDETSVVISVNSASDTSDFSSLAINGADDTTRIDVDTANFDFLGTGQSAMFDVTFDVVSGSDTVTRQITITINGVNDAPAAVAGGVSPTFHGGSGAIAVDPGVVLSDADDTMLNGAVVAIGAGFVAAEDTLAFVNTASISGFYDAGLGTLTLNGTASVADYQTALQSITYNNSNPTTPSSQRSVAFSVSDGEATSTSVTTTINIETSVQTGTPGIDALTGDANVDFLYGLGDDDTLMGLGGNDSLFGGEGQDTLSGGDDDDTLDGGNGQDILNGGNGNDVLFGGDVEDTLNGDAGNDTLTGGGGQDTLTGGTGSDVFVLLDDSTADVVTDFEFGDPGATTSDVDTIDIIDFGLADVSGLSAESDGFETIVYNNGTEIAYLPNAAVLSEINVIYDAGLTALVSVTNGGGTGGGFT